MSPAPSPILYLDHAPIWGGAEAVLVNLLRRLDQDRFYPLVATPADSFLAAPLKEHAIVQRPVAFGQLNGAGRMLSLRLVQSVGQVIQVARREHVALIHSNTVRTHIIGALAGALTGLPVIWTLHDNTFPVQLYRWLSPIPKRIITVSRWLQNYYGAPKIHHKMSVIPNGLPPKDFSSQRSTIREELGIPAEATLILNVGRLVEGKAPHLFIEAACAALRRTENSYFVLVGGVDEKERESQEYVAYLASMIENANVNGHIQLTGHRNDVHRFYAGADIFIYNAVQPEGLPTVILEAMQHKLPVIASAIGGAAEIVDDSVTGLLVAANDPCALQEAIFALIEDQAERTRLAMAGLNLVHSEYTLARQVERVQDLYTAVLSTEKRKKRPTSG
jgi:glycosyltransferase involved in cell wall biosynthesis